MNFYEAFDYTFAKCNQELVSDLLQKLKPPQHTAGCEVLRDVFEEVDGCRPLVYFASKDSEQLDDILNMEITPVLDHHHHQESGSGEGGREILAADDLEVMGVPDDLTELPEEVQLNIAKIKETLHCSDGALSETMDLRFMLTARPETVAALCDVLETERVADSKMASLLKSFASLKSEVSLINGVVFTKHALLPMVESRREDTVPRRLVESVVEFVRVLPHAGVEGLLVPLLKTGMPGKAQLEIVQAAVKEGIPKDHSALCLRRILLVSGCCQSIAVGLVHALVSKKGPLESVLSELTSWLSSVGEERCSDILFAKLLVDFLGIYGTSMSPVQLESISSVVSMNKTFLKKPIESLLGRFSG